MSESFRVFAGNLGATRQSDRSSERASKTLLLQEMRRADERDAVVTAKDERAKLSEADIERLKQRSIERTKKGGEDKRDGGREKGEGGGDGSQVAP